MKEISVGYLGLRELYGNGGFSNNGWNISKYNIGFINKTINYITLNKEIQRMK